jgi:5-methylthioadenosine/S-adenosylhomocysteine deaminase
MNSLTRRRLLCHTAAVVTTGIVPGCLALFAHPSAMKAAQQRGPVGPLPARGEFVIRGAHVITMDPALGDIAGGDVHVKDGSIVAVGRALNAPAATAISGERMIALPGLVETHWRPQFAASSLLRQATLAARGDRRRSRTLGLWLRAGEQAAAARACH